MINKETLLKKFIKLLIILNILGGILFTYSVSIILYSYRESLPQVAYSIEEINWLETQASINYNYYQYNYANLSTLQIKETLKEYYQPKFFNEVYADNLHNEGKTSLPLRKVLIASDLFGEKLCFVLAHEYVHLTRMISDERLTEYLTIKTLWESNIPYLQRVACKAISWNIQLKIDNKYKCVDQLINYFKDIW